MILSDFLLIFAVMKEILKELEGYADPVKKEVLPRFFKTGKGEYGEGDKFIGVVVPNIRAVAKKHKYAPMETVIAMLHGEWHECRLCGLLILVERYRKADGEERCRIFETYLANTSQINNWDLVDLSAPNIVGGYLKDKPRDVLYSLAESELLWNKRIAIVSTLTFIRNNDFMDTLRLAEIFMFQQGRMYDLMQKAIGWMLREVGKRDKDVLVAFLEKYAHSMPRTMLRYSIEKFSDEERKRYMMKDGNIKKEWR